MKKFIFMLGILGMARLTTASGVQAQMSCNFIITGEVQSASGNALPGITVNYVGVSVMGGANLSGVGYTNFYGQFYLNIPAPPGGGVYIFYLNFTGCDTGVAMPAFTLTPNNCGTPYWTGTTLLPGCDTGPCNTSMTVNPSMPQAGQPTVITASGIGTMPPSSLVLFENAAPIASGSGNAITWVPASGNVTYDVCVAAHYPGCVNVVCQSVPVAGNNPACFGHYFEPIHFMSGNQLTFSAYYYGSPSAGPATINWAFGDGTSSNLFNGTHTYAAPGTYTVCGTIAWANGCVLDSCFNVTVAGSGGCQANIFFVPDSSQNNYLAYLLGVTSNVPAAQINNVFWIVNPGQSFNTTSLVTPYTFPGPGGYNICAVVGFNNGCSYTVCDSLVISAPSNPCTNYNIVANAAPSTTSNVITYWVNLQSPQTPASVVWLLPNGTTATGYQGTFGFNTGGTVTLCAVATWPNGCVDTSCVTVNVSPNSNGSICGCAQLPQTGSVIPADVGVAYLVQYNPNNNTLNALATTGISNGQFCFQNVAPGAYLVKAALAPASPYYWNFVPTYYSNVPFWWQASQIVVSPSNSNVNIGCINLIPGINPGGPGFIGGSIFQGANKSAPGDPVPNVQVLLLNMDDSPVAYTYSDHLGQYGFSNLPYGTYKVWPEQAGIPTMPAIVTIGPDNPSLQDVNIALMSTGFVSVQTVGSPALEVSIGPNPASDWIVIRFQDIEASPIGLRLTDLQGRVALQRVINPSAEAEVILDIRHLPAGLYHLTLSCQGRESHYKLVRR
ncbi:MAG: PKD domain-containing protein [Flavobacteriales bacterium]|nr:PKD domain-containing protein [Flavobacteriales bacterium]